MSFQVSGLASGLDTSALIDGLMYAERATVRRLESSQKDEASALNAWTDIESNFDALESAIAGIRTGTGLTAASAESADESVVRVTAQAGALPGSYAFQVDSLAAAQQVTSAGLTSGADLVGAGTATVAGGFASLGAEVTGHTISDGTYTMIVSSVDTDASEATIIFDGIEQTAAIAGDGSFTVSAGDGGTLSVGSLEGAALRTGTASITVIEADATTSVNNVAAALNAAGGPVRAQVINTGDGTATSYRLVITSRQTGADHGADIDLSGLSLFSGGVTTLRDASDATVTLGGGGLTVTRPTNSIGDLFDGLSIDLVGLTSGEDVEVVVSADLDARVDAVTEVIDNVSKVLRKLRSYSSYDVDAERGGPLVGNFSVRSVTSEVNSAMTTVAASSGSFQLLSQLGISIQQDGTYTVDEVALREVLSSDPLGAKQVLVGDESVEDDGVFDVLTNAVSALLEENGKIPSAKAAAEANIEELDRLIVAQENRLETVEDRFRRQFTALETLIGQLQSQSGYLASVLGQQAANR